MNNYADSAYYSNTYKGAVIDTASFDLYARKATLEIKKYTFNRVDDTEIPEEVKTCCCELAETIYKSDPLNHNGISSEKVGEYSVSYESQAEIDAKLEGDTRTIIYNWLAMTGLLYRGC
ncbi:MAG TPA: hypothetical protein VN131_06745 [Mobilitalea sp.]|nr:hypothetical protein [Mobilitalea sp.]